MSISNLYLNNFTFCPNKEAALGNMGNFNCVVAIILTAQLLKNLQPVYCWLAKAATIIFTSKNSKYKLIFIALH